MHCPNCGKSTSVEQKFCRTCGLGLEQFAQLLTEQLQAVGLLFFLILFGIVYGVIIQKGQWLQGSIFLLLVLAAGCALGLVVYNESLKEKLAAGPATPPPAPDTAELLPEARSAPVASVTERTTALLTVARRGDK